MKTALAAQRHRIIELGRFGSVGIVGLLVDVALFNALLFTVTASHPWIAKAVSTAVSGTVCYFLNRHWTWAHRDRTGTQRELPLFLLVSALGLAITEVCLVGSHYGLGLTSRLADNVAANGVGLVLATVFRFWAYRTFVFPEVQPATAGAASPRHPVAAPTLAPSPDTIG